MWIVLNIFLNNLCEQLLRLEKASQTLELQASTVDIEERGVKLKLTVVDTPGFGDAINNTDW